jgi:hypothetical protein
MCYCEETERILRKMILQHPNYVFKSAVLEAIEVDKITSEALCLHSVIKKSKQCY